MIDTTQTILLPFATGVTLKSSPPRLDEELSIASMVYKPVPTSWRDVGNNIEEMDSTYGASFGQWLKNEDNIGMTSTYLYRIANEYPIDRIANALKWLFSGWTLNSITVVVRHITYDWVDVAKREARGTDPNQPQSFSMENIIATAETRRALLIREVTRDWNCSQIAQLVGSLAAFWPTQHHREIFLRSLTKAWDFCRLLELFSLLPASVALDYRAKASMLQGTAKGRSPATSTTTPAESSTAWTGPTRRTRKRSSSEVTEQEDTGNDSKRSRTYSDDRARPDSRSSSHTRASSTVQSLSVSSSPTTPTTTTGCAMGNLLESHADRGAVPASDLAVRLTVGTPATGAAAHFSTHPVPATPASCPPVTPSATATIPRQVLECGLACPLALSRTHNNCGPDQQCPSSEAIATITS
ncbi:hypothetical protein IWQ61_000698 [Dispira simplex]|nr:hypothetical protein IWQ61_000698 [Dispira simplex]